MNKGVSRPSEHDTKEKLQQKFRCVVVVASDACACHEHNNNWELDPLKDAASSSSSSSRFGKRSGFPLETLPFPVSPHKSMQISISPLISQIAVSRADTKGDEARLIATSPFFLFAVQPERLEKVKAVDRIISQSYVFR